MVQSLSDAYPAQMLCELLDLAPSTYYYAPQGRDDLRLLSRIEDVLLRFPRYGYRRVTAQLHREGHLVNHKRVLRMMCENDLLAAVTQRVRTTQSNHGYSHYPNLVQDIVVVRPNQVWCADITYVRLRRQFVYLAIILDVFIRSLPGWHLGRTLSSDLALTALDRALAQCSPEIHHAAQVLSPAVSWATDPSSNVTTMVPQSSQSIHPSRIQRGSSLLKLSMPLRFRTSALTDWGRIG